MMVQGGSPAHVAFDPAIATSLAVAALICLVGPLLAALWWHRRTRAPLGALGVGALVFLISQVILRLPWQIPLGRWVQGHSRWLIPFLLFSSFTAGLFEETGRWAGYKYLLRRERSRRVAVMFGIGHGALEAILLAGLPLAGLLVSWMLTRREGFLRAWYSKVFGTRWRDSMSGRSSWLRWSAPAPWRCTWAWR